MPTGRLRTKRERAGYEKKKEQYSSPSEGAPLLGAWRPRCG